MTRHVALAALCGVGLIGCGTKAADCEAFTKAVNASIESMKTQDAKDPKSLAVVIQKNADAAKAVQVKDTGLQPLVKEYVAVWEKGAAAARNIGNADEAVQKKAIADIEAMEKAEDVVVEKVNAYCK